MKEIKIVPEDIILFHIKILEQQIAQPKEKLYLEVAHSVMHNLEDQKIKINLKINLETCKGDKKKCSFVHFDIDFHYHINNLDDFYSLNEKQQPVFEALLIVTLLGISFSTARGIIYQKLQSAGIENILLPIINPRDMLIEAEKNKNHNQSK